MVLDKETLERLFGPNTMGQFEGNIKCAPQGKWPKHKPMMTAENGIFFPDEVKRVAVNAAARTLVTNGDFEFTEDPPNSEAIAERVAKLRMAKLPQ